MARPRKHDRKAIGAALFERMAAGGLVKDACEEIGVSPATVRKWAAEDAEFGAVYARAREEQAHAWAEKALDVANGDDALTLAREEAIEQASADLVATGDAQWRQKVRALENNLIQRDKLRVDTLKWMASKLAPRDYGERQAVEHGGRVTVSLEYVDGDD